MVTDRGTKGRTMSPIELFWTAKNQGRPPRGQLWMKVDQHTEQYSKVPMAEAVFDICIWSMSETTSGAYCQQWTAIRGATCICDAILSDNLKTLHRMLSSVTINFRYQKLS